MLLFSLASISCTIISHHSSLSTQTSQEQLWPEGCCAMSPKDSQLNSTTQPLCQTQTLLLHSPGFAFLFNLCIVTGFPASPSGAAQRRWYFSHIAWLLVLLSTLLWCVSNGSFDRPVEEPRYAQEISFNCTQLFPLNWPTK